MKNQFLKLTLILLIGFIVINNFIFFPKNILCWDIFGYYLYLPLKFIYNDLSLHDISTINSIIVKYQNTSNFYQAMVLPDGTYIMKYSMGMSILYSPFFFIAHIFSKTFNYDSDGFSFPYQMSVFIGSIFYSIIGLWTLSKVLLHFFSKNITAIVLFVFVFATNYIVHITMYGQNAMSHSYLFMMYSLILWLTILWHQYFKIKYILLLAIICGITILSRPSEVVCLIIPALWGVFDMKSFKEKLKLVLLYKRQFLLFSLILVLIGSFQFIYWKIHTGKFLFYSYGANPGEGFEFLTPYIFEVLLSFRKGWLIYTPIMIFAIIGFYFVFKLNRPIFYSIITYFVINVFIISSWSCWWYAQTYSQRPMIPSYPIMAIGLGYFIGWTLEQSKIVKGVITGLFVCLIFLNLFQTIQFHNGIIDGDRMTKEYYFKVFGKMYATEQDKKSLLVNRTFYGNEIPENVNDYKSKLFKLLDFEDSFKNDTSQIYSGMHSFKLDSFTINSPSINASYRELTSCDHAWIKVTAYVYPTKDVNTYPFNLNVNFNHNEYPYKLIRYESKNMKIELNKWNKIFFWYLTPEVRNKNDVFNVNFNNLGNSTFYIDNLQVEVFEKK